MAVKISRIRGKLKSFHRSFTFLTWFFLLFHTSKILKLSEMLQLTGFSKERSSNDEITIIRQLIEKRRYITWKPILSAWLQKIIVSCKYNHSWKIMDRRGYPKHLIEVIKSLHNTEIIINTARVTRDPITINRDVRQGCSLTQPYLRYIDNAIRK